MSGRRAIVTGVAGQDGSYLAELLLERGYDVVGIVRRRDAEDENLAGVRGRLELIEVDLLDQDALAAVLRAKAPHEVYNLASPSFVPKSWREPVAVAEFAAVGVTALLEAVRAVDPADPGRPGVVERDLRRAGGSAAVGVDAARPGDARTAPRRRTDTSSSAPTGAGTGCMRAARSSTTTSRLAGRSTSCRARWPMPRLPISLGLERELTLGDLDAERDWGYACDYVEAMWRMLQQDEPRDYVIATGELHSVRELTEIAFAHVGLDWREHVRVDDALKRGRWSSTISSATRRERVASSTGIRPSASKSSSTCSSMPRAPAWHERATGDHDFVTPPG